MRREKSGEAVEKGIPMDGCGTYGNLYVPGEGVVKKDFLRGILCFYCQRMKDGYVDRQ